MEIGDEEIRYAVQHTELLRAPQQPLATFGNTVLNYYLLTSPSYAEITDKEETVVRQGRVSAARPRIVTPRYLTKLEGFGENARKYLEMVTREYGPDAPGLLYAYQNEPKELSIVSERLEVVAAKLKQKVDQEGDKFAAIIKGVDELWDVSLLKFVRELTESSLLKNISDMSRLGLLEVDQARVPRDARIRMEWLFSQVKSGDADPSELKRELDRWELFPEYEDRFLDLFRSKR